MRSKFYVVSKEDKVGTVFSVAKYSEDKFRRTYINKIDSNGKQAYEDIIKYLASIGKDMKSTTFNTYKERLVGKGIIATSSNRDGLYWLTLPEFGDYVRLYHIEDE